VLTVNRRKPTFFCISTGARDFHQCRAADVLENQVFAIPSCSPGQAFKVHSAVIGFSPEWNHNDSTPKCPLTGATCTGSIYDHHPGIINCNGQRFCWISQHVLNHGPSDRLCREHADGNFIDVKYDCIRSRKKIKSSLRFL